MDSTSHRINLTLDPEYAARLTLLARRVHVQEGTLARSLLSSALDEADLDAQQITELLDAIPGAYERAQHGKQQAISGQTIPLDQL